MRRFFFNVQQGNEYVEDTEGQEIADLEGVRSEALTAAREVVAEGALAGKEWTSWSFNITDENGETVLRFPFSQAMQSD